MASRFCGNPRTGLSIRGDDQALDCLSAGSLERAQPAAASRYPSQNCSARPPCVSLEKK